MCITLSIIHTGADDQTEVQDLLTFWGQEVVVNEKVIVASIVE